MSSRRSPSRDEAKNQGAGSGVGDPLGAALPLGDGEADFCPAELDGDGTADRDADGEGLAEADSWALGVGDTRAAADDARGTGTWRRVGVEVAAFGWSAGASCEIGDDPGALTSRTPIPPETAKNAPVADAAITVATASADVTRRGSRSGAQMLSRFGSAPLYQSGGSVSTGPGAFTPPKPTGVFAPSNPMVGATTARRVASRSGLDSVPAADRWSRS
jgi:hypothetical protein